MSTCARRWTGLRPAADNPKQVRSTLPADRPRAALVAKVIIWPAQDPPASTRACKSEYGAQSCQKRVTWRRESPPAALWVFAFVWRVYLSLWRLAHGLCKAACKHCNDCFPGLEGFSLDTRHVSRQGWPETSLDLQRALVVPANRAEPTPEPLWL